MRQNHFEELVVKMNLDVLPPPCLAFAGVWCGVCGVVRCGVVWCVVWRVARGGWRVARGGWCVACGAACGVYCVVWCAV